MSVYLKRAYEPLQAQDGYRVLVDGLWPRGLSKDALQVQEWLKEIAPSRELRRWFGHDPDRWEEFRRRYFEELEAKGEALTELQERARQGTLTLVYAARDEEHNNAVALRDYLLRRK
ncbi:DUF488 family protein [Desulfuromonas sp. KJ2020]|uniref:DUF488 domain-containing protein n=1 Tax=Desulfuromonas sp. KJ2020 TaxID=2919173 RepID=UPI0020A7D89B|nr:DUF488 family protein [Desulfuromonas sp. KJ2020]MCP3176211.1 DUF488 family protein [Desulfuromonas sp. KJ2020]